MRARSALTAAVTMSVLAGGCAASGAGHETAPSPAITQAVGGEIPLDLQLPASLPPAVARVAVNAVWVDNCSRTRANSPGLLCTDGASGFFLTKGIVETAGHVWGANVKLRRCVQAAVSMHPVRGPSGDGYARVMLGGVNDYTSEADPPSDHATLVVDGTNTKVARLSYATSAKVGEKVFAIGFPPMGSNEQSAIDAIHGKYTVVGGVLLSAGEANQSELELAEGWKSYGPGPHENRLVPGDSGSMIVDSHGNVLGLTRAIDPNPINLRDSGYAASHLPPADELHEAFGEVINLNTASSDLHALQRSPACR